MKDQFSLDIQVPCSENFSQFTPTPNGGFCSSCEKEVIDFTTMSAEDTIAFFKNRSNKNTCGRFNSQQLKHYNNKPKQEKKLSFFVGIGLACLSLFSFGTMQAQDIKTQSEDLKNDASKFRITKHKKDITIKGYVTNESLPLPGATIYLEGTKIGIQTDFDGYFEFPEKLKKGDVLVFSYIGMESQKVVINNEHSASKIELQIDMKMDTCILMGKVAVKEVFTSKKRN
ncbi:hypothetical protein A9Q86_05460 [Flavobacteriales bacterium 33_180_T64]|nr:hypothetical protein A9Q86_05460 [Flavobacteriales bacterium 33_180_T64]